jgi:hypothetical protein
MEMALALYHLKRTNTDKSEEILVYNNYISSEDDRVKRRRTEKVPVVSKEKKKLCDILEDRNKCTGLEYAFWNVIASKDILNLILSFKTNGWKKYKYWFDGDKAARLGYHYMLKDRCNIMRFTEQSINCACLSGNKKTVKWMLQYMVGRNCIDSFLDSAAASGSLKVYKHISDNVSGCKRVSYSGLEGAVRNGHQEMVKHLLKDTTSDKNIRYNGVNLASVAIGVGNLEMVLILKEHGIKRTKKCDIESAIESKNKGLVEYLISRRTPALFDRRVGTLNAIETCDIDIVKIVLECTKKTNGKELTYAREALLASIETGSIQITELVFHKLFYDKKIRQIDAKNESDLVACLIHNAVIKGSVGIIEFLISKVVENPMVSNISVVGAATGGHLNMVKWCLEKRPECVVDCRENIMDEALRSKNLDLVKYLYDTLKDKIPQLISSKSLIIAIDEGNFDTVSWLLETVKDVEWNEKSASVAAYKNKLEVLKLLTNHSFKVCFSGGQSLDTIALSPTNTLPVLKWMYKNTQYRLVNVDRVYNSSICRGRIDFLDWMYKELKLEMKECYLYIAISKNKHVVVNWMLNEGAVKRYNIQDALSFAWTTKSMVIYNVIMKHSPEEARNIVPYKYNWDCSTHVISGTNVI